jgi:uncharacterized protein (DUF983 family)
LARAPAANSTSLTRMLARAVRKRCPLCGSKGLFTGWTRLRDTCPGCGYRFERESGYWVGAIIINLAVTEVLFGIMFITTLLATAPEVPWQPLLAVALATNGIFPWIFYPLSKTIWMAVDLYFHRPQHSRAR